LTVGLMIPLLASKAEMSTILDLALPNMSIYDFGQRPNQLFVDNVATVRLNPDCRVVSGMLGQGLFCGASSSFDGKYNVRACLGHQTDSERARASFEQSAKYWTYDTCLQMLLESPLKSECEQIGGKYGVVETLAARRAILPDCCISLADTSNGTCDCSSLTPSTSCANSCCCERAIKQSLPKGSASTQAAARKELTASFLDQHTSLVDRVHKECCGTRLLSQCSSQNDCTSLDQPTGRIETYTAFPLCCDYCLHFYDDRCGYAITDDRGMPSKQSMLDDAHRAITRAHCETQKFCSYTMPCLSRAPPRALGSAPCVALLLVAALLALAPALGRT